VDYRTETYLIYILNVVALLSRAKPVSWGLFCIVFGYNELWEADYCSSALHHELFSHCLTIQSTQLIMFQNEICSLLKKETDQSFYFRVPKVNFLHRQYQRATIFVNDFSVIDSNMHTETKTQRLVHRRASSWTGTSNLNTITDPSEAASSPSSSLLVLFPPLCDWTKKDCSCFFSNNANQCFQATGFRNKFSALCPQL